MIIFNFPFNPRRFEGFIGGGKPFRFVAASDLRKAGSIIYVWFAARSSKGNNSATIAETRSLKPPVARRYL